MSDNYHEPNYDCPGCQGGDKWPVKEPVWLCPVCDTEYRDTDAEPPAARPTASDAGVGE